MVREALALALPGIVVGLSVARLLTPFCASKLYRVAPTDPPILIGASVLVVAVCLAAAFVPARRAARVDPLMALRCD